MQEKQAWDSWKNKNGKARRKSSAVPKNAAAAWQRGSSPNSPPVTKAAGTCGVREPRTSSFPGWNDFWKVWAAATAGTGKILPPPPGDGLTEILSKPAWDGTLSFSLISSSDHHGTQLSTAFFQTACAENIIWPPRWLHGLPSQTGMNAQWLRPESSRIGSHHIAPSLFAQNPSVDHIWVKRTAGLPDGIHAHTSRESSALSIPSTTVASP